MVADVRFVRQLTSATLDQEELYLLHQANIVVIGAGGLGAPVCTYMCLAGVGKLTLIDYDSVDESNLNRQFFYRNEDIALEKTRLARLFLEERTLTRVSTIQQELTASNVAQLIPKDCQLVLNCLDNFRARQTVGAYCHSWGIDEIWGAVGGFDAYIGCNVPFSKIFPDPGDKQSNLPAVMGVVGGICGVAGSIMALAGIELLIGRECNLKGKVWSFNGTSFASQVLRV